MRTADEWDDNAFADLVKQAPNSPDDTEPGPYRRTPHLRPYEEHRLRNRLRSLRANSPPLTRGGLLGVERILRGRRNTPASAGRTRRPPRSNDDDGTVTFGISYVKIDDIVTILDELEQALAEHRGA